MIGCDFDMKRKRKRNLKKLFILSIFFIFCLITGYSAFSANISLKAKGNIYDKNELAFKTSDNGDGTVTITSYDASYGTVVDIPSMIKGKTVTKIGIDAFYKKKLTKVTIPNTLTEIGDSAFQMNSITSLEIPASVKKIGWYSFRYAGLYDLKLNEGIESLSLHAFADNFISKINIPSTVTYLGGGVFSANNVIGEDAFIYGRNSDGSIDYTTLDSYAGKDATGISIPDNVITLGDEAYTDVYYEKIDVPSRIKYISSFCFHGSYAKEVTLHEGLKAIYSSAFGFTSFSTIDIPSSVGYIENNVFNHNSNLEIINVNKKINSIENAPWGSDAKVNWIE